MTLTVKDAASLNVDLETRTGSGGDEQPTHNVTTEAGAGATIGATADAAVITNTTGTISGKLRGIIQLLIDLKTAIVLAAGELHIGEVGVHTELVTVIPTLSVAGTYAVDDYIGQSTTSEALGTAIRVAGKKATLNSVVLLDKAKQNVPMELWLFDRSTTVPTDNAAWTITDAAAAFCLGVVDLSGYRNSAANSICTVAGVGLSTIKASSGTSIYYALVVRAAGTWAANDLQLSVGFIQD